MPVKTKKIPPGLTKAFQGKGDDKRGHKIHGEAFEKIKRTPDKQSPHPVYVLGLDDLAGGADLSAAKEVGWRFLSSAQGQDFGFEFKSKGGGDEHEFASITEGGFVSGTRHLLKELGLKKEVKQRDYTFAMLTIPALYVGALWLRPEGDGDEMIIPIEPSPPYLDDARLYSPADFLALVQAEAKTTKASWKTGEEEKPPEASTPSDGTEAVKQTDDAKIEPPSEPQP